MVEDCVTHLYCKEKNNILLLRKQDWKWCQNSMNDPGSERISNRIINFDIVDLHPEVAARSKEILQKYRLDDVRNENEAAAIYYQWVSCYYHVLGTSLSK